MDNRVTWGKDMNDAVLFNGCIINQEIIFNANMNELRPLAGDGSASASMRQPPDACCCFCRIAAKSFHGMSSPAAVWETRGGRFAKYVLSKYLFAAKIAGKSWAI